MAKELPILPSNAQPAEGTAPEAVIYSRVFCKNENAPPLRLLMEFLKSRGQSPIRENSVFRASQPFFMRLQET